VIKNPPINNPVLGYESGQSFAKILLFIPQFIVSEPKSDNSPNPPKSGETSEGVDAKQFVVRYRPSSGKVG
jgi:hypothetical protein